MNVKYLIIGAGPTGLGAGYRLQELGEKDFLILEKNSYPGGLAASFRDQNGFTWDIGGHVLFSHYEYFDRLVDSLLGSDHLLHQRRAFIRIASRWVPYPFQNNIRYLSSELVWECISGLLDIDPSLVPVNFKEWILKVFGRGIAQLFMYPYNLKVWATPLELMDFKWIGERVSVIDLKRILKNIVLQKDDVSWGPNNMFKFPLNGGTGEIFRRLASKVKNHILYNQDVIFIDVKKKLLRCADGHDFYYKYLLNTSPLDKLILEFIRPDIDDIVNAASRLKHNGVFVTGVGIAAKSHDDKCWMYFPEDNCPFYRVTNFHNYSSNNVADPGNQVALLTEISYSRYKAEDFTTIFERTITGLIATTLMSSEDRNKIVSVWQFDAEYGYPIPCLQRDRALKMIHPFLEQYDIYSRGRFGGWKYEVGNMDHSVMQGVEWAEKMLLQQEEKTYQI
jgi:UDP-galactopyranose mutase